MIKVLGLALFLGFSIHANVEAKVCLNEAGVAAFKYTQKNLQTKFVRVFEYPESAISSVHLSGGIMDEKIYIVDLSGRRMTSNGTIIGPASFRIRVNVKPDCKISRVEQNY